MLMDAWFDAHDTPERTMYGPAGDALQVVRWDRYLISVKVRRAMPPGSSVPVSTKWRAGEFDPVASGIS